MTSSVGRRSGENNSASGVIDCDGCEHGEKTRKGFEVCETQYFIQKKWLNLPLIFRIEARKSKTNQARKYRIT